MCIRDRHIRYLLLQLLYLLLLENSLVLDWHYLDEILYVVFPVIEHGTGKLTACVETVSYTHLDVYKRQDLTAQIFHEQQAKLLQAFTGQAAFTDGRYTISQPRTTVIISVKK